MSRVIGTRKEVRVIDGQEREVIIQTIAPGYGGRSISRAAFGGKKGVKNSSRNGQIGLRDSEAERNAVR
jgi:hypothetical protein